MEAKKILIGRIAVVAGGSRGCGRGIAIALGDAGATVYVTGRTTRDGAKPHDGAPGTIEQTAEEVTARGGIGVAVCVDHTDPAQVEALFERVQQEQGRVDLVACAVWGGNERFTDPIWERPFWEQPSRTWQEFLDAGPHAFWLVAHAASRMMARQGFGLIVVISEPIIRQPEGQPSNVFGELAHHATNELVRALSVDASKAGITIIGLLPGFMRTERVQMHLPDEKSRMESRFDLTESTEYTGRAVVALAQGSEVISKSGKLLYVADLAEEYGFVDIDGVQVGNFFKIMGLI